MGGLCVNCTPGGVVVKGPGWRPVRGIRILGELQRGRARHTGGAERDGVAGPQKAKGQGKDARVGMLAGPHHPGPGGPLLIFLYFILRAMGNHGWILRRGHKVGFAFSKLTLAGKSKNG